MSEVRIILRSAPFNYTHHTSTFVGKERKEERREKAWEGRRKEEKDGGKEERKCQPLSIFTGMCLHTSGESIEVVLPLVGKILAPPRMSISSSPEPEKMLDFMAKGN